MEVYTQLLDEILVNIFGYLRLNDIKMCRLVCRQWYSCCEDRSIAEKYKLVFRSGVYSVKEINEILIGQSRDAMHVEFIGVKLKSLNIAEFGKRIQTLQITDCYFETVQPVVRILHSTPNLKSFDCHLAEEDRTTRKFLKKLTIDLRTNDSKFENLEKIKCVNGETWDEDMREDIPIQQLYEIFPRLQSVHFPIIDLHYLSIQPTMKEDIKELCGARLHGCNDDSSSRLNDFLTSMPKLKKLEINLMPGWDCPRFNSCLALFSLQQELETVRLHMDCEAEECDHWPDEQVDEIDQTKRCPAKQIFLHILTNCKKIKTLQFAVRCEVQFRLNEAETTQFDRAISTSNFVHLAIPTISFERGTLASHLGPLNNLEVLQLTRTCSYFDNPQDPDLSSYQLCEDIVKILASKKHLRELRVKIEVKSFKEADATVTVCEHWQDMNKVSHSGLELLNISLSTWTTPIIQSILSCRFPNLRSLSLTTPCEPWSLSARMEFTSDAKTDLLHWLHEMPTLTDLNLRWFRLTIEECVDICSKFSLLQRFQFESETEPKRAAVRKLFASCPTLREATIWTVLEESEYCEPAYYFANRAKKLLFIREIAALGSMIFSAISSI